MDGRQLRVGVVATVLTVGLAACGGDGGKDTARPATTERESRRAVGLAQPVYPRCVPPGFSKPRVRQLEEGDEPGSQSTWSLTYNRLRPSRPTQTTSVLIIEVAADTPLPRKPRPPARVVAISGRRVFFRSPSATTRAFAAEWKTSRAYYSAVANGREPAAIRRFIACLP